MASESKELKKARAAYTRALKNYHKKQDKMKAHVEKLKAEVNAAHGEIYATERRVIQLEEAEYGPLNQPRKPWGIT